MNHLTNFQTELEKQASSLAASVVLPSPNSGRIFMRLIRLPIDGPETIVDIKSFGKRFFISVTRFIEPLRFSYEIYRNQNINKSFCIPIEISTSECSENEPLVKECRSVSIYDIKTYFSSSDIRDFFYFFCTDSVNCTRAFTSSPHNYKDELWQRIINRSYGAELIPRRRYSRRISSNFIL